MGAGAGRARLEEERGEEINIAFQETDTNSNGLIEAKELGVLVKKLVSADEYLHGCGEEDIKVLTELILTKFRAARKMLNRQQFADFFQQALIDEDHTRDFLRMAWSEVGIARMKEAQQVWIDSSSKKLSKKRVNGGDTSDVVFGGLFNSVGMV